MYTYLIVDDEMIERKGIRMLLSWMNIRENILEASNGEEALEVFEKEKIDVLLTDINMPFMDGIELLSRIHEEYPGDGNRDFQRVRRVFLREKGDFLRCFRLYFKTGQPGRI